MKYKIARDGVQYNTAIDCVTTKTIDNAIKPFIIKDKQNIIHNKRRFRKIWKLK